MAAHEQAQPRSAFSFLQNIMNPQANNAAAGQTPATTAGARVPWLDVHPSVFAPTEDLSLNGRPVTPQRTQPGPTVDAAAAANAARDAAAHARPGPTIENAATQEAAARANPTVAAYGNILDRSIDASIASNRTTRSQLDTRRAAGASTAAETETGLNEDREELLET